MNKFLYMASILCVGLLGAQAEEISEVYFNPSPKGNYDVLRVGSKLQSKGGLDAASVNINGTVDAAAGGTVDGTYAYKFGTAGSGGVMGIDGQDGKINMPAANFQVTDMAVKGGEAVFAATGVSVASTIGTLGNNINQTGILEADGDLSAVAGGNLSVVITGENVAGLGMSGFELGGNRIPIPTECESSGALFWANRKASNGTTYQVLAVKRCEGQQPECHSPLIGQTKAHSYGKTSAGIEKYKKACGGLYSSAPGVYAGHVSNANGYVSYSKLSDQSAYTYFSELYPDGTAISLEADYSSLFAARLLAAGEKDYPPCSSFFTPSDTDGTSRYVWICLGQRSFTGGGSGYVTIEQRIGKCVCQD